MSLDPSHGLIKVKTAYENLIAEVSVLDKKHAASNPARRIGRRLQPLIDFVERYAIAIDVAVQGTLSPATLVWGALRGLLVVSVCREIQRTWPLSTLTQFHLPGCGLLQSIF